MKINISDVTNNVYKFMGKHSPVILTGFGVAGFTLAIIEAVRATPKAMALIDKEKEKKEAELTKMEVIKVAWKCYMPTTALGVLSAWSIIAAQRESLRRNAALAAAYSLSESAFKEYKTKVIETMGERKEQKVRDAVAEQKVRDNPVSSNEVIITGKGQTLCYDAVSGRYFRSDIEKIRKVENQLNKKLINEMYVSLNDYYDLIGLYPLQHKDDSLYKTNGIGDDLGWNVDKGLIEFKISTTLSENGEPCIVVDFWIEPRYDYTDLH